MVGKHKFPAFLTPRSKVEAFSKAHRNKISNWKDISSSLNVEAAYRKQFPAQQNQHFWDYYLSTGMPRKLEHKYLEVHPGLLPNRNVIDEMEKKVNWLTVQIESGELPPTKGAFIWARASGSSDLSRQEKQRVSLLGLAWPKNRVEV